MKPRFLIIITNLYIIFMKYYFCILSTREICIFTDDSSVYVKRNTKSSDAMTAKKDCSSDKRKNIFEILNEMIFLLSRTKKNVHDYDSFVLTRA